VGRDVFDVFPLRLGAVLPLGEAEMNPHPHIAEHQGDAHEQQTQPRIARTRFDLRLVPSQSSAYPFFSTDPNATALQIIEAFVDRATIEQDFHDVKEVWGAGRQQVRNIWTNVAVYHLNLWIHTLVELWCWNRSHTELSDRSLSPWDDAERRPSHADRRIALRRQIMEHELSTLAAVGRLPQKNPPTDRPSDDLGHVM
jgi:hypothetical protein